MDPPLPDTGDLTARTARTLELAARAPISVSELAGELAVDPRTARRLLARLEAVAMLQRRDGRWPRWAPGPALVTLAQAVGGG